MLKVWKIATLAAVVVLSVNLAQAETINLATGNSGSAGASIGGTFQAIWVDQQSTGTGVIDSFVRIQAQENEEGYNTSAGTPMDTLGGNFTHSLQLSAVPIVTVGGTQYREFLLDVNQTGADPLISLNQVQIFLSAAQAPANLTSAGTNPPILTFAGATEIFRMSGVGAVDEIILDASRNSGSGSGDMLLYVPNSNFTGAATQFVTLYSQFGTPPGANDSNAGFEEWAVREGVAPPPVPEPTSLILLGLGFVGVGAIARARARRR
ncbi:MAG TPA: PEP-CTERM sorting domain-containing protein [Terriglobia bacterium]|nr:PEP-CTERM sorting domain-containing protein [Terriglobia bacterium]